MLLQHVYAENGKLYFDMKGVINCAKNTQDQPEFKNFLSG